MELQMFSSGYTAQRLHTSVYDVRRAAEQLKIMPVQWIDDVDYYANSDVVKLRQYFEHDNREVRR
jgi:hypothetical protein